MSGITERRTCGVLGGWALGCPDTGAAERRVAARITL
jgi:hypothetical protein